MSISPSGRKRKAWDSNPHPREGARISSAARQTVSGYLPFSVDLMGVEPTTPTLQGSVASNGMQAHACQEVRPGIEPGPPPYHGGVLPEHLQTVLLLLHSDPGWNRTITLLGVIQASSPLDHGIMLSVTEVGVEPTKSRGSRPRRFACLRTRSSSGGSGGRTRQARLMRPR